MSNNKYIWHWIITSYTSFTKSVTIRQTFLYCFEYLLVVEKERFYSKYSVTALKHDYRMWCSHNNQSKPSSPEFISLFAIKFRYFHTKIYAKMHCKIPRKKLIKGRLYKKDNYRWLADIRTSNRKTYTRWWWHSKRHNGAKCKKNVSHTSVL